MENKIKKLCTILKMSVLALLVATSSYAEHSTVFLNEHLQYDDLKVGTGEMAEDGRVVVIHFTGWLDDGGEKGDLIFNSRESGKPIVFKTGTDMVIKAWNMGVVGMKVGGIRRLICGSEVAYGANGSGDVIPPHSGLIFEIELLEVR